MRHKWRGLIDWDHLRNQRDRPVVLTQGELVAILFMLAVAGAMVIALLWEIGGK